MENEETDPFHLVSDFMPQRRALTDAEHYVLSCVCIATMSLSEDFILILFQGLKNSFSVK